MRTIFPSKYEGNGEADTTPTQKTPDSARCDGATARRGEPDMKWPKKVKHRNKVLAKVYRPCAGRDSYRVTWYATGQRMMKSFRHYSGKGGALEFAEAKVKELAAGSNAAALTHEQATDTLVALARLENFYCDTGKRISIFQAVDRYCESAGKLNGILLGEAVDGYLTNVASVRRKDLGEAVEEFIASEEPRTRAKEGERPQLSPKFHYNRAIQLRRFAGAFQNYAVCDLTKDQLDPFLSSKAMKDFSAKSRNHHRAAIRQFLKWAVRKDYLSPTHRLNEADRLRPERANTSEVHCYTAKEFRVLLATADGPMQAMIAIGGLAGLRTQELLRLDWADVWRVPGHIEVTAGKAKTRQRRLLEICPALAAWLEPLRACKTGSLWQGHEATFQEHCRELWKQADVPRKDNGLRHSFCSHAYTLHGGDWTAKQAGNSPSMIHGHYKGLAMKKESQAWFAVKPAKSGRSIIPLPCQA
jgi:integrase